MVNNSDALDATFAALADPTRRAIVARLARGEAAVSDLAGPLPMSLPAVLKHLSALERAGLVQGDKRGRVRHCRLEPAPLSEAVAWITRHHRFWEERFQALDRYLEATLEETETCSPSASPARSRRRAKRSSGPGSTRPR
jgi:DNA-binding transcriptional ArsR family regulator